MNVGVKNISGDPHILSHHQARMHTVHGGLSGKVLAVDAIYLYTFSDSHIAVGQVRNGTSDAQVASGQYY